jgi:hypothetical protein
MDQSTLEIISTELIKVKDQIWKYWTELITGYGPEYSGEY